MTQADTYRRAVNGFNKVVIALQKVGIVFGPMRLLTAPGAKSGEPRTAPVAVLPLDGQRYIMQAYPKAAWVANARAADTVTLTKGRRSATVRLVEVPVPERGPILRELAANAPESARKRFVTNGLAEEPTPDAIAAAAPKIAVFRVETV